MRRALFVTIIGLFCLFLASACAPSAVAGGSEFIVTRADDPPVEGCAVGNCSLREAVIEANASAGSTIRITVPHIDLSIAGSDNEAQTGDLDLLVDVTIIGAEGGTTIDANGINAVFEIPTFNFPEPSGADVLLTGLTVRGAVDGPGIFNAGNLTLDHVTVTGNTNQDDDGGGVVSNAGLLTVQNSTISNNHAGLTGGGIEGRDVIIENSTVTGNTSGEGGGGVSAGGLQMTNTTVTGNTAGGDFGGGGVVVSTFLTNLPPSTITNSTIADNESSDAGGGVLAFNGSPLSITNSILWGNSGSSGSQCSGSITGGINVVQSAAGCNLTGSVLGNDPGLFPLGEYGGPTQTMGIPEASSAKDVADDTACPDTDQRGIPRPQHNPDSDCDIGSYEYTYLGDVDCSGTVAAPDIIAELTAIAGLGDPDCYYRGDLDCNRELQGVDGLFIVRHLALLEEAPERSQYCPLIGPDSPP